MTSTRTSRSEAAPLAISERVGTIVGNRVWTTEPPTQTERDGYQIASKAFAGILAGLRKLAEEDLVSLEDRLEKSRGSLDSRTFSSMEKVTLEGPLRGKPCGATPKPDET